MGILLARLKSIRSAPHQLRFVPGVACLALLLGVSSSSHASEGWAFAGSGSGGPQIARLELATISGAQVIPAFNQATSVVVNGVQIGNSFGNQFVAGFCCESAPPVRENRSSFAFDLSNVAAISSATLILPVDPTVPGRGSIYAPRGSLTYTVHGVPPMTEGSFMFGGDVEQFEYLGTGPAFGSLAMTNADNKVLEIRIPLNAGGVVYLNGVRQYPNPGQPPPFDPPYRTAVFGGAVTLPPEPIPVVGTHVLLLLQAFFLVAAYVAAGRRIRQAQPGRGRPAWASRR